MDISIWWLDEKDCEAIEGHLKESVAGYVREEFQKRFGRPGGGRLWVSEVVENDLGPNIQISVDPWPRTPLGVRLLQTHGGIVIRDRDAWFLQQMPGIVTDLQLNRVDISIFA